MAFSFRMKNPVAPAARVILTFDDGHETVYTQALPYMASAGITGVAYIVSDWINQAGRMTPAQLLALDAAGWTIGNHTKAHGYFDTDAMTQAQIEAALSGCNDALVDWGIATGGLHVAYPGGQNSATSLAAMRATGMLSGRTVSALTQNNPAGVNPFGLTCNIIGYNETLQLAKDKIDAAIAAKKCQVFGFHEIVETAANANQWSIANFQALIDYIEAADIQAVNIAEFYDVMVNS